MKEEQTDIILQSASGTIHHVMCTFNAMAQNVDNP